MYCFQQPFIFLLWMGLFWGWGIAALPIRPVLRGGACDAGHSIAVMGIKMDIETEHACKPLCINDLQARFFSLIQILHPDRKRVFGHSVSLFVFAYAIPVNEKIKHECSV